MCYLQINSVTEVSTAWNPSLCSIWRLWIGFSHWAERSEPWKDCTVRRHEYTHQNRSTFFGGQRSCRRRTWYPAKTPAGLWEKALPENVRCAFLWFWVMPVHLCCRMLQHLAKELQDCQDCIRRSKLVFCSTLCSGETTFPDISTCSRTSSLQVNSLFPPTARKGRFLFCAQVYLFTNSYPAAWNPGGLLLSVGWPSTEFGSVSEYHY